MTTCSLQTLFNEIAQLEKSFIIFITHVFVPFIVIIKFLYSLHKGVLGFWGKQKNQHQAKNPGLVQAQTKAETTQEK